MEYRKFDYHGFEGLDFEFDGLNAKIVKPKVKPNGMWVYKTEYFTAFPGTEIEFLNRGYHLAYNENYTRWAPDSDLVRKGEFIKFISKEFNLSKKCIPVGMSCGGMYAVKVAAMFPELIEAMYIDAPVMNLLSCPCDLGVGSSGLFDEYYRVMKTTKSQLLSYRENPIDKMHVLLENDIPVVLVAGGSDNVVPFEENGKLLEDYYKANGGRIKVYIKPDCAHHPHGLEDPTIVVNDVEEFLRENQTK